EERGASSACRQTSLFRIADVECITEDLVGAAINDHARRDRQSLGMAPNRNKSIAARASETEADDRVWQADQVVSAKRGQVTTRDGTTANHRISKVSTYGLPVWSRSARSCRDCVHAFHIKNVC